jgi:DNA-binding GntR family transcriptional regulator
MLEIKKVKQPTSLGEHTYQALKKSLLRMDISQMAGDIRLDERELAEQLGVSRTPLREAIGRLELEGFVKVIPRKGVFVVKKTKREIIEILITRAALEGMAARLAVERVTDEQIEEMRAIFAPFTPDNITERYFEYADANIRFHELILSISQCGRLIEMAGSLYDHIRWIRFQAITFEERSHKTHQDHISIMEAISRRDPDLAAKSMREHILDLARYIEEHVDFLS